MDFNYLPGKIKTELEALVKEKMPVAILRANGNIEGAPGEGYVVAFDDKVMMFSRGIGEDGYRVIDASYRGDVVNATIRKEKFNSFLDVDVSGKKYSIKFSSFDEKDLKPMLDKWSSVAGSAGEVHATAPTTPANANKRPPALSAEQLRPRVGLLATLMFLAMVDGEIDKTEDDYIKKIGKGDSVLLQAGFALFKGMTFEELLERLSYIDHQQKLCFLANMIEMGMIDGVLHRSEQAMIRQFADRMGVSAEEHRTIKDVLLIKNQISVLS